MKDNLLRIGLAQINSCVGDLEGNRKKIFEFVEKAKENACDLVVFPELAITGYPPEDLLLKKHFISDNIKTLNSLVKEIKQITAVIGFVDQNKNHIFNAAAVITDGKLKGIYHKKNLPNYSVFDEKRYFESGFKNPLFKVGKFICAVNICEDIWEEGGVYAQQKKSGANLLINISASPYYIDKINLRKKMLSRRAKDLNDFVCYCNLVGGQDELVFDGGSFIFDKKGKLIAFGKQFQEDLLIADLGIVGAAPSGRPKNIGQPRQMSRLEEVYSALVLGTRDYITKNGFKKVVIGLSGGIDSALVVAIAVDALGRENVVGVSMPSQYTSLGTKTDAEILAKNLKIKFLTIPIDGIFNTYLDNLQKEFSGRAKDTTEENLQARIRGNILMSLSNKFGWLVLTTGNKSETSVGYCTLYGDMAGGFAVIKDVFKTLVYDLAYFRNEKDKIIPETIFTRSPSAELKENQRDQDSLPDYEVLDHILKGYIEEDKSIEQIIAKKFDADIVKKVIKLVDTNEYKRRQAPPGIKITPKAFGKDRRLPITNKYNK
ncbi:MAG: NAD+ synthase [Candidatus Omnitrophota bacterium]